MNDVVKRRMAGALLLVAVAFIAVSMLPEVRKGDAESGVQIVTIALDGSAPETVSSAAESSAPAQIAAAPALPAADDPAALPPDAELEEAGASSGMVEDPAQDAEAEAAAAAVATPKAPSVPKAEKPAAPPTPVPSVKPAPAVAAEPKAPTTSAPTAAAVRPVQKAVAPAPAPPPESRSASVAPSAAVGNTPAAATGGRWYVQVGGFAEIANAHQAQDRLKAAGQASIIAPAETARGTLYRVRAGPYASREAAAAARVALVAAGFGEPAVVGP